MRNIDNISFDFYTTSVSFSIIKSRDCRASLATTFFLECHCACLAVALRRWKERSEESLRDIRR